MAKENTIQRHFDIPVEDFEKFNRLYPQHGAWAWWMRVALKSFLDLHEASNPEELIRLASEETARQIAPNYEGEEDEGE